MLHNKLSEHFFDNVKMKTKLSEGEEDVRKSGCFSETFIKLSYYQACFYLHQDFRSKSGCTPAPNAFENCDK